MDSDEEKMRRKIRKIVDQNMEPLIFWDADGRRQC